MENIIEEITPVRKLRTQEEVKDATEQLMMAENPIGEKVEESKRSLQRLGTPDLLSVETMDELDSDDLKIAIDEWDTTQKKLAEMYENQTQYYEWEVRRARMLEKLALHAEERFDQSSSTRTEQHRVFVEIKMWASFAKHLILRVNVEDVVNIEDEYGFVDLELKHHINEAIMTTGSLFESAGEEIMIRNHGLDPDSHMGMADISNKLYSHDYITRQEKDVIDDFRRDVRNRIAHDILQRTRFDDYGDFRSEVITPCWEVIDISERLAEKELAPK